MSDEPIELKLKLKYLSTEPYKFGGKKRNKSNEGKTGRRFRAACRSLCPGGHKKKARK